MCCVGVRVYEQMLKLYRGNKKKSIWYNRDRAVARAASAPGGGAVGRGFELCSTHDSHQGFFSHINGAASLV